MNEKGFSIKEYFENAYYDDATRFRELTRLDSNDMIRYNELLQELKIVHDPGSKTSENSTVYKGQALEEIVTFLIKRSCIFDVVANIRSSTNEIDQTLELNHIGIDLKKFIKLPGDLFLSECKNYNKKVDVTWIGKFYSLLAHNHAKLGILFSYKGFTGQGWNDGVGLVKKIYLLKEDINEKVYIIDINKKDFELISEGESLIGIIHAKIKALRLDTDFKKFLLSNHPAMENET
ncbi:restriction endonuclease [Paenibacillus nuruki]|uniref:restriction endonuclease n=1 Tax=Paenibacillus nuruki TaxID=1886670 RepID=UPI0028048C8E|nr:restriction endonuclease [Paenibacillus nuruki]CAJ1315890.1 Acetylglutamate semialdehyde dehydrogenase [Paenibacillus nuruki]